MHLDLIIIKLDLNDASSITLALVNISLDYNNLESKLRIFLTDIVILKGPRLPYYLVESITEQMDKGLKDCIIYYTGTLIKLHCKEGLSLPLQLPQLLAHTHTHS